MCRHRGPVQVVLRNYSTGTYWACQRSTSARERAANTNPRYSEVRQRAAAAYNARKRRKRLLDRTLRHLQALTKEERQTVLSRLDATTFGTGIDQFEAAPRLTDGTGTLNGN
jgi:hypothetical protein